MKAFFRLLFKLNHKYDRLREPWKILVFMGPIILAAVLGGGIILFTDNVMLSFFSSQWATIVMAFFAAFRLPIFFLKRDWIYTYKVGLPYHFSNKVKIEYANGQRKEISKWTRHNMKLYRGVFVAGGSGHNESFGQATFYFAKASDAMAFKLSCL